MCRHLQKRRRIVARIHGATMATVPILILTKPCPPQVHATDAYAVVVNPVLRAMPEAGESARTDTVIVSLASPSHPQLRDGRTAERETPHTTTMRPVGNPEKRGESKNVRCRAHSIVICALCQVKGICVRGSWTNTPPSTDFSERHIQHGNDPVDLRRRDDEGRREGNHAFEAWHRCAVFTDDDPMLLRRRNHAVHLLGR